MQITNRLSYSVAMWLLLAVASTSLAVGLQSGKAPEATIRHDLSGTVLDASGKPVDKATVYVYTAAPRTGTSPYCPSCYVDCGKRQTTDFTGKFLIPALDSTLIFRLLVVRDGYEPMFVSNADVLKGLTITLPPPSPKADRQHSIDGRVIDASGKPVVGASLELIGIKTSTQETYGSVPGYSPLAITGEQGTFHFSCPTTNASIAVLVNARGLASKAVSWLPSGATVLHNIQMDDGTTVEGTIRDTGGRGIPGVTVQLAPVDCGSLTFTGWLEIATDKDGRYSLPNVPANQKYRVCTRMDSLSASGRAVPSRVIKSGKNGAITSGIDLDAHDAGVIQGRVVLPDDKPIPENTRIMLSREDTWDVTFATVSPNGAFSFKTVPCEERLKLAIQVPGYHINPKAGGYNAITRGVHLYIESRNRSLTLELPLELNKPGS